MAGSTSTGARMPITERSALSRSRGVRCVVDGAQAAVRPMALEESYRTYSNGNGV